MRSHTVTVLRVSKSDFKEVLRVWSGLWWFNTLLRSYRGDASWRSTVIASSRPSLKQKFHACVTTCDTAKCNVLSRTTFFHLYTPTKQVFWLSCVMETQHYLGYNIVRKRLLQWLTLTLIALFSDWLQYMLDADWLLDFLLMPCIVIQCNT